MEIVELIILFISSLLFVVVLIYKRITIQIKEINNIKENKMGFEGIIWNSIRKYVEFGYFNMYDVTRAIEYNIRYFYRKNLISKSQYETILKIINKIMNGKFVINRRKIFINLLNEYIKLKND